MNFIKIFTKYLVQVFHVQSDNRRKQVASTIPLLTHQM